MTTLWLDVWGGEARDAKAERVWTRSEEHQQKVAEVGTGRREV